MLANVTTRSSRPVLLLAALSCVACVSSTEEDTASDNEGSGGQTATGGAFDGDTTGGAASTGGGAATGGTASGGVPGTGGLGNTGGTLATGGAPTTGGSFGSGGDFTPTGGMPGTGGEQGSGGDTGSGGGGSDECVIGQTQGSEVAVIGESFIAATHEITQRIEMHARAQGSLGENESYVDNSVSGTTLGNNQIPSQYDNAVASSGTIRYVLMDGGGNDCLLNNDGATALAAAEDLFENMAQNGTEKVVYFFYPDPIGSQFNSLKTCLDQLRPQMQALCEGLTSPECFWLDQREIWDGHPEYTNDGIHPTTAGSNASGDAIWEVMQENCVAQ